MAGVGGTGVVTIGALVTMAAHLEGIAFSTVDQFGMAQKGGAVTSHVRIAARAEDMRAIRLNAGAADLVLGCDSLVACGDLALDVMHPERTRVIVNTHEQITGQFARNPDLEFPTDSIVGRIRARRRGPETSSFWTRPASRHGSSATPSRATSSFSGTRTSRDWSRSPGPPSNGPSSSTGSRWR